MRSIVAFYLLSLPALLWAQGEEPTEPTGQLTRPPELIHFVEAPYPPEAEAQGITGEVVLRLIISEEGVVTEAVVEKPVGHGFDEAAVKAAQSFRFRPAEIDNQPASVQIFYRYGFTLKEQVEEVPVKGPLGAIRGLLLQRGTRAPLAGISLRLSDGQESISDAQGAFEFKEVPAGSVTLIIEDKEFYTLEDEEEVVAGQATVLKYYLERRGGGDSILVVGRRIRKEVARRTLTMEEIRKIPGTSGDALKVVQNLPGVARVPFGGGGLIVRGSNPGDSIAALNRHFIPVAFHFGGLRSVFPSELLESIDFYPGNFGAEYGRYGGGIIDVRIRRPKEDGLHGRVEADVFDAGFLLEGPLTEHSTFALAGRRSYIDFILQAALPSDAGVSFSVAPKYYDYQALWDWKHSGHRVRLYFFGSDDELELLLDEAAEDEPDAVGTFRNETNFYRLYGAWDVEINKDLSNHISASVGQNALYFSGVTELLFDNVITVITVREDLQLKLSEQNSLRLGADLEMFLGNIEIRAPQPPKEGGSRELPMSAQEIKEVHRDFQMVQPGLWMEAELKFLDKRLLLIPGLRFDYEPDLEDYALDPRLSARFTLQEGTIFKGGAGWYMQRPSPDEYDETFGNPDIELEHTFQVSGGIEQDLSPWLGTGIELDVLGFYKYLYNSVARVDDPNIFYTNDGKGRVYGLELLLRRNMSERFFGWISYTLMRSERKDGPDEEWRLFDFDQTHILTILAQYKLTNTWEAGFRWRYVSGNPYRPYQGCVRDDDGDVCVAYPLNTGEHRLDPFHQLDIRVDRNWIFNTWILTAYLEIQNAYNRQNPEFPFYNHDYTQQEEISGLPVIPSFGLRGAF